MPKFSWKATLASKAIGLVVAIAMAGVTSLAPARAAEKVKLSVFQSNFCCFPVYVAKHLKLFEKHGVDVDLVYGSGIQVANIFVSGSAELGAFAVEHGVTVSSQGPGSQDDRARAAIAAAEPDRPQGRADAECRTSPIRRT